LLPANQSVPFLESRAVKKLNAVAGLAIALTIGVAAQAQAAELLTNGGFENIGAGATPESWGGLTYYPDGTHPGNVALPGWTVESGSVDLTQTTSLWGPADTGTYSLDINGWDAGVISQTFNTLAGRTYTVSYAYSRNAAGAPDPAIATLAVGGVTQTITAFNDQSLFGTPYNMRWQTGGFSFVGTGSPTTIRLSAVTPGNGGVFFDSVSVQGGVPEPAAWALMIFGFGLTGATLRARRRAVAVAA
jgi:hypothetical protein